MGPNCRNPSAKVTCSEVLIVTCTAHAMLQSTKGKSTQPKESSRAPKSRKARPAEAGCRAATKRSGGTTAHLQPITRSRTRTHRTPPKQQTRQQAHRQKRASITFRITTALNVKQPAQSTRGPPQPVRPHFSPVLLNPESAVTTLRTISSTANPLKTNHNAHPPPSTPS